MKDMLVHTNTSLVSVDCPTDVETSYSLMINVASNSKFQVVFTRHCYRPRYPSRSILCLCPIFIYFSY